MPDQCILTPEAVRQKRRGGGESSSPRRKSGAKALNLQVLALFHLARCTEVAYR
ncbi:hypothetical protein RR11_3476 [Ruegeria sp. R11]|nr:hypothetical protein RR11_3476 [Ruegeria sp. R11]